MKPVTVLSNTFLERLDRAAARFPERTAFGSESGVLTYAQLLEATEHIGSALAGRLPPRQTVGVLMRRDIWTVAAIFGVIQSGCICAPLDPSMPADRLEKVFQTLAPACLIADDSAKALAEMDLPCSVVSYEELAACPIDRDLLVSRREQMAVTDPIQILYTSGSTGLPKGVVHTHRSMLGYADRGLDQTHTINSDQVYGSQAPLFYANSLNDTYLAINSGCTVWMIPDRFFLFPAQLVEYLNEKRITTLLMTPMNYVYIADSGVLEPGCLPYLQSVYLSGEVVSFDKVQIWAKAAPHAECSNFYGSTESPYTAQYVLDEADALAGAAMPSGTPLRGVRVLVVDENGEEAAPGQTGELYVASPWVSSGYYRDPERTAQTFLRDPLGFGWDQIWYRTGDLGYWNDKGQLMVRGRKDTQIKHRGYRMDVGEVDAALRSVEGWQNGCCLFSESEDLLYCFWTGPLTQEALQAAMAERLERYKQPNRWIWLETLPRTATSKLDRMALKANYFGK